MRPFWFAYQNISLTCAPYYSQAVETMSKVETPDEQDIAALTKLVADDDDFDADDDDNDMEEDGRERLNQTMAVFTQVDKNIKFDNSFAQPVFKAPAVPTVSPVANKNKLEAEMKKLKMELEHVKKDHQKLRDDGLRAQGEVRFNN